MEIRQFRVTLHARDFERTCHFYGEVLSLPRLQSWERDDGRGAVFSASSGAIEVLGRPSQADARVFDEQFDTRGPSHELSITLLVPSAERAYEELLERDRNVPGGLREEVDGSLVFETHDPDGVRVSLLQFPE